MFLSCSLDFSFLIDIFLYFVYLFCVYIITQIYIKIKKQKDKYFIAFLLSYLFIFLIKNV